MHDIDLPTIETDKIEIGFESDLITVDINHLISTRLPNTAHKNKIKYQQILTSIQEIGIIEPPVVSPDKNSSGRYYILDGHLRIRALKDLNMPDVLCLVSNDDESFTYNKHINRLSTIQEHKMIVKAVERGVSEEKIASVLNLDVRSIISKRKMLDGITQDAVDLLKDKMVPKGVFEILKRMKPIRQIECAQLMNSLNSYSVPYARALLTGTSSDKLLNPNQYNGLKGLNPDQIATMQSEMLSLENEYKIIEEDLGSNILNLTIAKGYIKKLMDNNDVIKYLTQHYPEIYEEFITITDLKSLNNQEIEYEKPETDTEIIEPTLL